MKKNIIEWFIVSVMIIGIIVLMLLTCMFMDILDDSKYDIQYSTTQISKI